MKAENQLLATARARSSCLLLRRQAQGHATVTTLTSSTVFAGYRAADSDTTAGTTLAGRPLPDSERLTPFGRSAADHAPLEFDEAAKHYGRVRALDGITLTVGRGECALVTGVNGSGKTTLLKLIVGLVAADRGSVKLFGRDAAGRPDHPAAARPHPFGPATALAPERGRLNHGLHTGHRRLCIPNGPARPSRDCHRSACTRSSGCDRRVPVPLLLTAQLLWIVMPFSFAMIAFQRLNV